jgi:class 3 adenylate cyclase
MKMPFEFLRERKPEIDSLMASDFEIKNVTQIPNNENIPLEGNKWLKAETISCVYIDLVKSTELQVIKEPKSTAKIYQLFVENMVRTLDNYDAEFIDVRGDGGFGIFVGSRASISSLCAAITFKTLCSRHLENLFANFKIKPHIGIDQKTVLFKQIGMRGDRKNVVWAGKPVNMAAKLASLADAQQVAISERVYQVFKSVECSRYAVMSCGCVSGISGNTSTNLWAEKDVTDVKFFDFDRAYTNPALWCEKHGDEYCAALMKVVGKKTVENNIFDQFGKW